MDLMDLLGKLDAEKYDLLGTGYAFDLVIIDKDGSPYHVGIGTAEQMAIMNMIKLTDMYTGAAKKAVGIEEFAEGVKKSLIRFYDEYKDDLEGMVVPS